MKPALIIASIIAAAVLFCLLGGCAQVSKAARVGMAKPAASEDLKWISLLEKYGTDLAPSRDCRAGALKGMVIVEYDNLPLSIRKSVDAVIALGNEDSPEFLAGYDAGLRLNLYYQATQGGVMGLINLLTKFGIKL